MAASQSPVLSPGEGRESLCFLCAPAGQPPARPKPEGLACSPSRCACSIRGPGAASNELPLPAGRHTRCSPASGFTGKPACWPAGAPGPPGSPVSQERPGTPHPLNFGKNDPSACHACGVPCVLPRFLQTPEFSVLRLRSALSSGFHRTRCLSFSLFSCLWAGAS